MLTGGKFDLEKSLKRRSFGDPRARGHSDFYINVVDQNTGLHDHPQCYDGNGQVSYGCPTMMADKGKDQIGAFSIYEHSNFGGKSFSAAVPITKGANQCYVIRNTGLEDHVSSIKIGNQGLVLQFFKDNNCEGESIVTRQLTTEQITDLGKTELNDKISSWKIYLKK